MAFSYSSWRAARRPWVLEIDGRSWTAEPVSAEAILRYQGTMATGSSTDGWRAVLRLLRLAFPWRWSYWWRGDPVRAFQRVIRDSPDAAKVALADFFPLLRGATPTPPSASRIHGTR